MQPLAPLPWPEAPPPDYPGPRPGDLVAFNGCDRLVVDLSPNVDHWCQRGWACKASWLLVCELLSPGGTA